MDEAKPSPLPAHGRRYRDRIRTASLDEVPRSPKALCQRWEPTTKGWSPRQLRYWSNSNSAVLTVSRAFWAQIRPKTWVPRRKPAVLVVSEQQRRESEGLHPAAGDDHEGDPKQHQHRHHHGAEHDRVDSQTVAVALSGWPSVGNELWDHHVHSGSGMQ